MDFAELHIKVLELLAGLTIPKTYEIKVVTYFNHELHYEFSFGFKGYAKKMLIWCYKSDSPQTILERYREIQTLLNFNNCKLYSKLREL